MAEVNERAAAPEGAADGWEIAGNIRQWKQGKKRAFLKTLREVELTLDEGLLYPMLTQVISKWPYDLDPSKVESYDEITVEQYGEVERRVIEAFQLATKKAG